MPAQYNWKEDDTIKDNEIVSMGVHAPYTPSAHVIRKGGQGFKQIHDISGAQVAAYTLAAGSHDKCHVSIQGTNV